MADLVYGIVNVVILLMSSETSGPTRHVLWERMPLIMKAAIG